MSTSLLRTPLYDWHLAHQARIVDFAGWSMPVQYSSIVDEHRATRTSVTLFDISHMGRLRFSGADAVRFLDQLTTRRVADMKPGRIRYGLLTNPEGRILDDILVYAPLPTLGGSTTSISRPDRDISGDWMMVVNAGNREKVVAWIDSQLQSGSWDVRVEDSSIDTAMIAVQGPHGLDVAAQLWGDAVRQLKYYTGAQTEYDGQPLIVSRTGYTGEDGVEVVCAADQAASLWEALMRSGEPYRIQPAGLGARDTLRLEAAMPLYGHELSEQIDPFQAGLDFAVNLEPERQFVGADALRQIRKQGVRLQRVGLELDGKRVPREHYPVVVGTDVVGEVTSGTFSPTFDRPLAMAYVPPDHATIGSQLAIDIRGRFEPARVVPLPFYRRA